MKKVAIVPAYNEEERIGEVLKVLKRTDIDEIIVVDDGSEDGTREAVKNYDVRYLRNSTNKGKGYSMDKGVKETDAEIIFFCDADLTGLTPDIVEGIIKPVLNGKDMFLGIMDRRKEKSEFLNLLTGQRALKREVWDKLPEIYKKKYRIEVGLNKFVERNGYSYGYDFFPYSQVKKKEKEGMLAGALKALLMIFSVYIGYFTSIFKNSFSW